VANTLLLLLLLLLNPLLPWPRRQLLMSFFFPRKMLGVEAGAATEVAEEKAAAAEDMDMDRCGRGNVVP